jgi:MFS transporter, ACS family, hexuronate transporter
MHSSGLRSDIPVAPSAPGGPNRRPISNLRWWIGGLLFFSTVINYVDRQTLSVLAPFLKEDYKWTNEDYALIVISFRIAYTIGQLTLGRFIDRVGTRRGLSLTVLGYSLVAMLTSVVAFFSSPTAVFRGFLGFRFLLGLGESPNWPAATKAVAEWFPKKERGWAVALFDSGSSLGAAIAPMIVIGLYLGTGRQWWPAFIVTGALGLLWLVLWRRFYHPPEVHPRISEAERRMILADKVDAGESELSSNASKPTWAELLKLPQTWGIIAARAFTDPVWYFVADWFMLYLVQEKHFDPKNTLLAVWIPFIAVDIGNFAGGGVSSWLIQRGWRVEQARKSVVGFGAVGMTALAPAIYATNLFAIAGWFALATFAYACFCTMALVLPSDLFKSDSVASVSGMSGAAAGCITIVATYLIGGVTTHHSFAPVLIVGSIIPVIGAAITWWLVRNPSTELQRRFLRRI